MSSHLRTLLLGTAHIERPAIVGWGGLRVGAVITALTCLTVAVGEPKLAMGLILGALFVGVAEIGEGIGRRWRTMAWVNAWLMLSTFVAVLVSEHPVLSVLASTVVAAIAGLAGLAGPRAALAGLLCLVAFTITVGAPELPRDAVQVSLLVGLGGVVMTVVTVVPHLFRHAKQISVANTVPVSPWNQLKGRLTWSEPFVRYAARLAVAIALATTISQITTSPHDYWLPMTVAWVTKANLDGTVQRVAARVLGTVVGLLCCAALLFGVGVTGYPAAIICGVAAGITAAFIWANYSIAVATITVLVVVVFALDGDAVGEDLIVRLVSTLGAGVIAVAVSYLWRSAPRASAA